MTGHSRHHCHCIIPQKWTKLRSAYVATVVTSIKPSRSGLAQRKNGRILDRPRFVSRGMRVGFWREQSREFPHCIIPQKRPKFSSLTAAAPADRDNLGLIYNANLWIQIFSKLEIGKVVVVIIL